ncbi:D-arabinono-1,4-lactone oxidase [Nakamurella sp. GG22]
MTSLTNWSGNYSYQAPRLHRPGSVAELQDIVAGAEHAKALGSRHCFNDIADTPGDLIDTTGLPDDIRIDAGADGTGTVTVSGSINYGRLATALQARSLALPNLASLPHISVAGAVATGTHGSGVRNQALGGAVRALEFVLADGELRTLTRGEEFFDGAVVSLGALGIVSRVTLDVEPTFDVRQDVFEDLPWSALEEHIADIVSSAYSVSLFTDLQGDTVTQVWCKTRMGENDSGSAVFDSAGRVRESFFGATPATVARHPLPGLPGDVCTGQFGIAGPWHDRLPHFQLDFTPSNGDEVQTEYLVARDRASEVVAALRKMAPRIAPLLQVCEIRTVAADDLWLSPAYGRDTVAFHFTWRREQPAVEALLVDIETAIVDCHPRPHWGKLFAADAAALTTAYPRLTDFRALATELDPTGVFRNAYLDRLVFTG